jgi:hypothetical protein
MIWAERYCHESTAYSEKYLNLVCLNFVLVSDVPIKDFIVLWGRVIFIYSKRQMSSNLVSLIAQKQKKVSMAGCVHVFICIFNDTPFKSHL